MMHATFWLVVMVIAVGLALQGPLAMSAEKGKSTDKGEPTVPASVSKVDGTDLVRVTLTPEAARRLDITTAIVRERHIRPPRTFWGEVISISRDLNIAIVRLELTEKDAGRVQRGEPASILPLASDSKGPSIEAFPVKEPTRVGLHGPPGTLYYETTSADHGLAQRQLVLAELRLAGSDKRRKIIPYAAVLYDPEGRTWVYTNPARLVFVRRRIDIDTIVGNEVIVRQGPPAGTAVVTVGAAELYGTEIGVGK